MNLPIEVFEAVIYSKVKDCELAVLGFFILRKYKTGDGSPAAFTSYSIASEVGFHRANVDVALKSLVRTRHLSLSEVGGYSLGPVFSALVSVAQSATTEVDLVAQSATSHKESVAHCATSSDETVAQSATKEPKALRDAQLVEPSHNRNAGAPVSVIREREIISPQRAKTDEIIFVDDLTKALGAKFASSKDAIIAIAKRYLAAGLSDDLIVTSLIATVAGTTSPPQLARFFAKSLQESLAPPEGQNTRDDDEDAPTPRQVYVPLTPEELAEGERNMKLAAARWAKNPPVILNQAKDSLHARSNMGGSSPAAKP